MNRNLIEKLENLIKVSNEEKYYEYLKVLHIYKFIVSTVHEFDYEDRFEIITYYYENILGELDSIYDGLEEDESFIFYGDKIREKGFRISLEYLKNRNLLRLSNEKAIDLIEEGKGYYPQELINFLRTNSRTLDEIYSFNDESFKDKLENLEREEEFYKVYSDPCWDLIIIRKNFFSELNPSYYSRGGLILRFCESGQIIYEKEAIFLNEKEVLVSRGVQLGGYKVLTNKINYITIHIKEEFFKLFEIEFSNYILKKYPWKLDSESIKVLEGLGSCENPKLLILNLISKILINLQGKEDEIRIKKAMDSDLLKTVKYIDKNLKKKLVLTDIQKELGINKNILYNLFNEYYGIPVSKYILNKKLEKTADLLIETDMSITEIAYQFNFTNPSKFSGHFKNKYSLTPLQFKKKFEKIIKI